MVLFDIGNKKNKTVDSDLNIINQKKTLQK